MSFRVNPPGWKEILEIMTHKRPIEDFPRFYEPIAHMHSCLEVRMTNPRTMETKTYGLLAIAAYSDDLEMVKYLVNYFREKMGTGNIWARRNLLLMAADACEAAEEWRAYSCWAYLRRVAREEKPHCPDYASRADELRPTIFYAMEDMVSTTTFKQLVDAGFCDLDETHEGMTPHAYAVAKRPVYTEILDAIVGKRATVVVVV